MPTTIGPRPRTGPDVAPQAGDNLRFVGTASTNTENDFTAGTSFGSIEFASSGFELTGNSLTLTNGISVDAGVSTATISTDAVALGGPVTINVADANASLTISGNISGSNNLAKTGTGTLLLAGANTYTGTTTINAGILQAKKTVVLPGYNIAGKVVVNDGGTISVNAGGTGEWQPADIQALHTNATFNGHSALGIDTTYATTPFTYPNAISRAWGFTKLGSNTLILTANNTYNGVTTISGGTLQINNGGTLGAGDITNSGTLAFNHTDGVTVSKVISGIGNLVQQGTGTLILTGANTYTGTTTINAGTLQVGGGYYYGGSYYSGTSGTLGSGNVLVNSGGSLAFARNTSSGGSLVVGNAIRGPATEPDWLGHGDANGQQRRFQRNRNPRRLEFRFPNVLQVGNSGTTARWARPQSTVVPMLHCNSIFSAGQRVTSPLQTALASRWFGAAP